MPPPLGELTAVTRLDHEARVGEQRTSRRDVLYGLLRREQAIAVSGRSTPGPEVPRILDFAQAAYGDVVGVLVGRDDRLLDTARDGEWTLRDVLRHAMAVELRYAAQVEYSATRSDAEPGPNPAGPSPLRPPVTA